MSVVRSIYCSCSSSKSKNISDFMDLKNLLPVSYNYNVCYFEVSDGGFVCQFRIDIKSKENALLWMEEFTYSSYTTFRTDKVFPQNGRRNIYKVSKYCHHRVKPDKRYKQVSMKNTDCSARLVLTVKKTTSCKSKDIHLRDFPTVVLLSHTHNHPLNSASVLRFRHPSPEVKETYINMFKAGLTPSKAFHQYTSELQDIYEDKYDLIKVDRALNPSIQWVYYTYHQIFKEEYQISTRKDMMEYLKKFILSYNIEQGDNCAQMKLFVNGNYVVVIVSPMMHRVLNGIPQASEVLFCDSTGSVDRFGTKIFLLLTNSCCDGLPVGIILTSSEAEEALIQSLEMFKSLIGDNAFGGRGKLGPRIIMTDDDTAERNAFRKVFPDSTSLLSIFHILQACWRYFCSSASRMSFNNRQELFPLVKNMLYAASAVEYQKLYYNVINLPYVKTNKKVLSYLIKLDDRKREWALHCCTDIILQGQSTNSICESSIRVLKDRVLSRKKAYSVVQLLNFLASDLNNFYIRKMVAIANGHPPAYLVQKLNFPEEMLHGLSVMKESSTSYIVTNDKSKSVSIVDTHLGLCSCYRGKIGQMCKHQQKVASIFSIDLGLALPVTAEEKQKLLFIATGNTSVPVDWFSPLQKHLENAIIPDISDENEPEPIISDEEEVAATTTKEQQDDNNSTEEQVVAEFLNIFNSIAIEGIGNIGRIDAMKKLVENYKKIKTEAALNFALATFGKFGGHTSKRKVQLSSSGNIGRPPKISCTKERDTFTRTKK